MFSPITLSSSSPSAEQNMMGVNSVAGLLRTRLAKSNPLMCSIIMSTIISVYTDKSISSASSAL